MSTVATAPKRAKTPPPTPALPAQEAVEGPASAPDPFAALRAEIARLEADERALDEASAFLRGPVEGPRDRAAPVLVLLLTTLGDEESLDACEEGDPIALLLAAIEEDRAIAEAAVAGEGSERCEGGTALWPLFRKVALLRELRRRALRLRQARAELAAGEAKAAEDAARLSRWGAAPADRAAALAALDGPEWLTRDQLAERTGLDARRLYEAMPDVGAPIFAGVAGSPVAVAGDRMRLAEAVLREAEEGVVVPSSRRRRRAGGAP